MSQRLSAGWIRCFQSTPKKAAFDGSQEVFGRPSASVIVRAEHAPYARPAAPSGALEPPMQLPRPSAVRTVALTLLALATPGCKRGHRLFHRDSHAHTASHRARVVAPAQCTDEAHTPPARAVVHVDGTVEQMAVAGNVRGALIAASVDGAVQVAAVPYETRPRAPAPRFVRVGTGQPGVDHERDLQLVALGDGFVAAWRRTHANLESTVSIRLRADGSALAPERAEPLDDARPGLALASSGTGYAISRVTAGTVTVELFGADGTPRGNPVVLPGSAGATATALTAMDTDYLASWVSTETPPATIIVARVQPARESAQQVSGLRTVGNAPRPALAGGRDHFVLAYVDNTAAGTDRLGAFATAFEPAGVRVVEPIHLGDPVLAAAPDVVWNGSNFAIAWSERGDDGTVRARWAALDANATAVARTLDVRDGAVPNGGDAGARLAWDGEAYVLARRGAGAGDVAIHRFGVRGCDAR